MFVRFLIGISLSWAVVVIAKDCLEPDSVRPKCFEWINNASHGEPVFIEHIFNCSRFWVCEPDLSVCLNECAPSGPDSNLYFDVRDQYPKGPTCNWPNVINCTMKPIDCSVCHPWQECLPGPPVVCTPECKIHTHCKDDEWCDYVEDIHEDGKCHKGCRDDTGCEPVGCATCEEHVCTKPECCSDSDCTADCAFAECQADHTCTKPECCSDDDCPGGEKCVEGLCQGCAANADCDGFNAVCNADYTNCNYCDVDNSECKPGCGSDANCEGKCTDDHTCVDCFADEDCPGAHEVCDATYSNCNYCEGNGCNPGCASDENCDGKCTDDHKCVDCFADEDCPGAHEVCDATYSNCNYCEGNGCNPGCASDENCDGKCTDDHKCVGCLANEDCPGAHEVCDLNYSNCNYCDDQSCKPGCATSMNCQGDDTCNDDHRCQTVGTAGLKSIKFTTSSCVGCEAGPKENGITVSMVGKIMANTHKCTTKPLDHPQSVDYQNNQEAEFKEKELLDQCYHAPLFHQITDGWVEWSQDATWSPKDKQITFTWTDGDLDIACCLSPATLTPSSKRAKLVNCMEISMGQTLKC